MSASPRLFVIMASKASVAVVVRRGPSAWTRLTLWDTRRDVFTPGSWLRGRVYAEKCDLSPDGMLFVYAAHQGRRLGTTYTDSWTAISRPPSFHALVLWPMGTTYGGGGRFVGNRRLVLRGARETHADHPCRGVEVVDGVAELHRSTGQVANAEWTGRDQANRLVFASGGRILRRAGATDVELVNLSHEEPSASPPPVEAKRAIR